MRPKIVRLVVFLVNGLVSVLMAAGLVLWFYTQTDNFRGLLHDQALIALQDSVNGEVSFERISGSIWTELHFHDLTIFQNDAEILSTPQVTVKVDLFRQAISFFLSSSLHIDKIEIREPWIRLAEDKEQGWNIISLFKKADEPEESPRVSVFLDQIKTDGGRIDVRMADGREAVLAAISLAGRLSLLSSGIKADLDVLDFSLASKGIPDTRWSSVFSYEATDSLSSVDLRRLDLRTGGSHVRISGKVRDLAAPNMAVTVELKKAAAEEIRKLLPTLSLQQDLHGNLQLSGPLSAFQIGGLLNARDGELHASVLADLTRTPAWFQGTIETKHFVVDRVLKVSNLSGKVNGKASFKGASLETAEGSARAQVSGLFIQGWQIGDVALSGNLANKKVALTGEARGKGGQASVEGKITLDTIPAYEATLQFRNLNVQKIKADSQSALLDATVNLNAWVKGRGTSLESMDTGAKVNLLSSKVGPVAISEGRASAALRDGRLTLQEVRLFAGDTTLSAEGQIGVLQQQPHGKIDYSLRSKNVAPWLELAGLKGKGGANLNGTASGELKALRLQGKANLSNFQVAGSSFQRGTVTWALTDVGTSQPRGAIKASANGLNTAVRLQTLEATVDLKGMNPADIAADVTAQDYDKHVHRLKAHARYLPERLDLLLHELSLQFPTGVWRTPQQARLVVRGKTVTIDDLLLQSGTQNVRAKGVVGLEGSQDLYVQVNRFSLEDLRPFLENFRDISGQLSAAVRLQGTAISPVIETTLSTDTVKIAGQSYAGLTGKGSYRQERLNVDMVLRQDASHSLNLNGGVPLYLGWGGGKSPAVLGNANLRVYSDGLSPAFLSAFSRDIEKIQGNLTMDIQLRGAAHALVPSGKAGLQRGQATVKPLGISLTDVELQAKVAPNAIHVTQLGARSGSGKVTGNGELALKGYTISALGVTLNADNFQVINTRQYKAAVSGHLASSGSLERPFIRGNLTLAESRLRPDLNLLKRPGTSPPDPTIIVVQNRGELTARRNQVKKPRADDGEVSEDGTAAQNGFFHRLGLDVTAVVPRGTWLYLDEASIELMGEVRVRKNPTEQLYLTGGIETVRGWYAFQGRKFQIERGRATFTGGNKIDPSLDVLGRYTVQKYEIELVVGGNVSKPTLTLRSNPRLEQADILSVLLFGKPVGGLNEGQRTSLQAQAIKAAGDYVAPGLQRSVADRLGVDNLEFGTGEGLSGGKIGVGKYVTKDVFVSTSQEFGDKKEQEYSVEYQITPNWQLKSSTTSQGKSGIDLFWRKEY
ncbi:MAG: translocation/assembly module TamB domain-containing protein [Candidatus Binatia bacterium]